MSNPKICFLLNVNPKNALPIISVFKGVNEFKVELIELLICVCAKANKKIGKKLPNNPAKKIYLNFVLGILKNSLPKNTPKKSEVKSIL